MKRTIFLMPLLLSLSLYAQIGIKAGLNFSNVTNAASFNSSHRGGFMGGIFFATPSKVMGYRTEIIYSKQGYDFKTGTNTGNVNLDYILLPQLTTINISKFFQLQLGAQMAFLINAKADSSNAAPAVPGEAGQMMDYYNKFNYGLAGGIEIHPFKGLLVGARVNIGLGDMYKNPESYSTTTPPSFIPKTDVKSNVFMLFAGWQFGK
jgi:Outer membrane protein beta-barrel domain